MLSVGKGNNQPDNSMAMQPIDNQMGGGMMPQDDMMGGEMPMDNNPMPGEGADFGGASQDAQQSDFDTNFDAGVEADEDTDPKKYIQQLTGKLSTTLNSYNSENGDDEGLNKYVAKMIVKASTKNMDDATKKDIIKAINTSQNPEPDDTEELPGDENLDTQEQENPEMDGQQPMMECFNKKQILDLAKRRKKK